MLYQVYLSIEGGISLRLVVIIMMFCLILTTLLSGIGALFSH